MWRKCMNKFYAKFNNMLCTELMLYNNLSTNAYEVLTKFGVVALSTFYMNQLGLGLGSRKVPSPDYRSTTRQPSNFYRLQLLINVQLQLSTEFSNR